MKPHIAHYGCGPHRRAGPGRALFRRTPTMDALADAPANADKVQLVAEVLKRSARGAKTMGNVCIGMTLLLGFAILTAFLYFSQVTAAQRTEKERGLLELRFEQRKELAVTVEDVLSRLAKSTDQASTAEAARNLLESIGQRQSTPRDDPINDRLEEITYEITSSVIRIGAGLSGYFLSRSWSRLHDITSRFPSISQWRPH